MRTARAIRAVAFGAEGAGRQLDHERRRPGNVAFDQPVAVPG